ncbi:MAG: type II secretion system protein GspD [Deltaproteobacteria bacterium CG_4_8_14_3_um_filter_45_9]|nr:MAG: type II secretion system protein GspD [Deltaproteobacteria bacterium CG_4_8_14_3_um_filter_45_9]
MKRGKYNHMEKISRFWMKILLFCLVAWIVSYPGMETELGAEPISKMGSFRLESPISAVVAQASSFQPSTPTPTPSQPPTTLQPPPSTPVQPAEVPTPKSVSPLQPQPLPAPSTATPTPTPSPPVQLPSPKRRLMHQPSTSPTTQPPTSTTQPPAAPAQPRPSPPTTGQAQAPVPTPPATPAAPPSPPVTPTPPRMGSGVVFNFDNADIYEVIRVMAEIMKITYIVDPKVKGIVNIHTSGQISSEDIFPVFQSVLRLNGATAVKKDGVYEIVPLIDAKKLPIPPSTTRESGKPPSEERYTIQIVSLKFIPVAEVSKMIKPFLSDGADIVEHPPNNILIIGDLASNVKKSVDIINLFDLDIFTDLRVRIYPILNADVAEVAKEMERIFSSFEVSTKSGRGVGITFTPITRINSLLVVSSIPNIFEKVEGWLKELDKIPTEGTKFSVFVYYVQNAKAKDLADVLKQVFVTAKDKKAEYKGKITEQPTYPRGVKPPPTPSPTTPPKEEGGAIPEGEINIVVDEANNALVIRAFARDYKSILETVKKLDLYPKQVLIEALLAEITLDDTYKFGIEWARFISSKTPNAQEVVMGSRPPADPFSAALAQGSFIRYSIVELGGRISAAVNAAAADNRLNVISSPHILASNNKEAKIQIGTSEPIFTNTYTTTASIDTSTGLPSVIEGTIEYKDVGIILTVTPRISDAGLITLEIQIEKSDASTKDVFGRTGVPYFDKKTAKTTLSVLEGQTIVIGGLIEDTKKRNKGGVPLLSKIPLLGALFGTHDLQDKKKELVLLMTPHIITDHIQSKTVTDDFKEKVEGIKKELEKERMKREKK